MQRFKNIAATIVIMTLIVLCSIGIKHNVYAADNKSYNNVDPETATTKAVRQAYTDVVEAILTSNLSVLYDQNNKFENDCYMNTINNLKKGSIIHSDEMIGISNIAMDRILPDKSSTGDTVLMFNITAQFNENYKQAYLVELHIDKNKLIYGYNAWVY